MTAEPTFCTPRTLTTLGTFVRGTYEGLAGIYTKGEAEESLSLLACFVVLIGSISWAEVSVYLGLGSE